MDIKVSIITCHFVHNYGAVLQAYALKKRIETDYCNSDVSLLDYRPEYLAKHHRVFHIGAEKYRRNFILKLMYIVRTFPFRFTTYRNFNSFVKNRLNLSKKRYESFSDLCLDPPKADIHICGSDQIWNTSVENGKDASYYLCYAKDSYKFAYAPSFAVSEISTDDMNLISPWISQLDKISVREQEGARILEQMGFSNVPVVIDPVFLLNRKEWEDITAKQKRKKKYVLIYKITDNVKLYRVANEVAQKLGADVIEIGFSARCGGKVDKYICGCSPEKFLSYIKNADYVITDSFHGICFSMIFNKEFIAFHRGAFNSRLASLLQKTDLLSRFYSEDRSIEFWLDEKIDYGNVENLLSGEIANSKEYLRGEIERG